MTTEIWLGAVFPASAAATRYRLLGLQRPLEELGASVHHWSLIPSQSWPRWVNGSRQEKLTILAANAKNLMPANLDLGRSAVAVIQRELLPINSLLVERRLAKPFVWDVDDFVWQQSQSRIGWRGSESKYEWLAQNAAAVWVGNENLGDWATSVGAGNVTLVPSSATIPETWGERAPEPHLAWVGTPSTAPFLEDFLFRFGRELRDFTVDVVGAVVSHPDDLRVNQYPWSEEAERRALSRAWAGLYPIDLAHPMAAGKSAFKAVLYMSYGLPVLATRARSTTYVVKSGQDGFLCSSDRDWIDALGLMHEERLRGELAVSARKRACSDFDREKIYSHLARQVLDLRRQVS